MHLPQDFADLLAAFAAAEAKRAAGRPQDLVDAERLVRRKAQQTPA